MKSIAVVGLGRFGMELVKNLSERDDVEVMAIDTNPENVNEAAKYIQNVFICDCKKENALREIGIQNVDHAIVAFGQSESEKLVSTVVTTILLKKLGIKEITVRLDNDTYEETIISIGATNIIHPLRVASERLANNLCNTMFLDNITLAGDYNIFELKVSPIFIETKVSDLVEVIKQKINIILVEREDESFIPSGSDIIKPNDVIYIFGEEHKVNKVAKHFTLMD